MTGNTVDCRLYDYQTLKFIITVMELPQVPAKDSIIRVSENLFQVTSTVYNSVPGAWVEPDKHHQFIGPVDLFVKSLGVADFRLTEEG